MFERRKQSGFTLIEILVVVVIIGLLLGVVAYNVRDAFDKGTLSRIKQDLNVIKVGLQSYEMANFQLPTEEQGIQALVQKPSVAPVPRTYPAKGFIENLPLDPWQNPYHYQRLGDDYNVCSFGRDGQRGGESVDADVCLFAFE